jgi:hypothetical protein
MEERLEIRLLVYSSNAKTMRKSIHAISKNTEASLISCKKTVEETKYMTMCLQQNAEQNNQTNMGNKPFKVWNI